MSVSSFLRWARQRSASRASDLSFTDAIVFGGLSRYFRQRSRRFVFLRGVEQGLHGAELLVVFLFATQQSFLVIAAASLALEIASAFWWGALEVLREGARTRSRDGRHAVVGKWIEAWLRTSLALCLVVMLVPCGLVAANTEFVQSGAVAAYVLVRLAGFAFELPVRCFHAGAYGLGRLHLPTPLLLAPSLARVACLAALWPLIHTWALAVGAILGTAAFCYSMVWSAARAYSRRRIDVRLRNDRCAAGQHKLRAGDLWQALWSGLANLNACSGHICLLLLLWFGTTDAQLWLGAFIFLLLAAPALEASSAWVRLFYPDHARLESPLLARYRGALRLRLLSFAPWVGLISWLAVAPLALALPGAAVDLLMVTGCIFVGRARLAAIHWLAFFDGFRLTPPLLGILVPGAIVAATLLLPTVDLRWLAAAYAWLAFALPLPPARCGRLAGIQPLPSVMRMALDLQEPGRWVCCRLGGDRYLYGPDLLQQRMARRFGVLGVNGRWMLWWTKQGGAAGDELLAGGVDLRFESPCADNARAGLRQLIGATGFASLRAPVSRKDVTRAFRERFPSGQCVVAGQVPHPTFEMAPAVRNQVLRNATNALHGREPGVRLPVDITAWQSGTDLSLIFLVPRDGVPKRAFTEWRDWLQRAQISNALHLLLPAPPLPGPLHIRASAA